MFVSMLVAFNEFRYNLLNKSLGLDVERDSRSVSHLLVGLYSVRFQQT
jgi:hypothetical protein